MLTKAEIEVQGYKLTDRGTVASPGKFEGEPWWVVALWDRVLDADADDETDDEGTMISHFRGPREWDENHGIVAGSEVLVWEDDSGFVRHVTRRYA